MERLQPKKLLRYSGLPAAVLFLLVFVIEVILTHTTISATFLRSFLNTNTTLACLVIGESVVIISGGIDISIGPLVSFCTMLLVRILESNVSPAVAILLTLLVAIAAGGINGFVVAYMKVTPLLTTYATSIIFGGLALLISSSPVYLNSPALMGFFRMTPLGVPMSALFILVPFLIWQIFRLMPEGIRLYAVGADEKKAFLSGINVAKSKMLVYMFAGLCSGIGALAMTFLVGGGDPLLGASMSMKAVSAAVIGGVSLSGGKGGILGGIFGILFLSMLTNIIVALKVDAYGQELYTALILVFSVLISVLISKRSHK